MLCEHCLNEFVLPRLREDDLLVLKHLYNENVILPQTAKFRDDIVKEVNLSSFKTNMALYRLECYSLVELRPWKKSHHYYLSELGIKAFTILTNKIKRINKAC